jgi:hypothetical protein
MAQQLDFLMARWLDGLVAQRLNDSTAQWLDGLIFWDNKDGRQ